MTTRILVSQITAPAANVGQALVATANGVAGFGVVASAGTSSARSVGVSLVFS